MKSVNSLNRDRKVSDAGAFIEFLSSRPDVKGDRFGATGYCMGGNCCLDRSPVRSQIDLRRSRRFTAAIWPRTNPTALISS